jgi:hypothetical protein
MGADCRGRLGWLTLLLFLAFLLAPFPLAGKITFERTYGGIEFDWGQSVQQTQDGGYIVAGQTQSFGPWDYDVYLVKTDSVGDTVWTRTYGGNHDDAGWSVQQTQDAGYVVAGFTMSFGAGDYDVYLVKTDSLGDSVWTRTYGGFDADLGYSVQQTEDRGYIIAGETHSFDMGSGDVYLVKTDSVGDTVWTRTYGGSDWDFGYSVQQTQDGGYVVGGQTRSFGAGNYDVYLVKTDSVGDTLWTRTYGGPGIDVGTSVQQTQDGGYIITGGPYDVYLIKVDSVGDTLWMRTYGGSYAQLGRSVEQTQDGGYIVAGYTGFSGGYEEDVYLVKTNSLGDTVWTRTYGGIDCDNGYSVQQTQDGGYVIAGFTVSFGVGSRDVYLIKTDENGLTGVDEKGTAFLLSHRAFRLFQNSPNPLRQSTSILYSLPVTTEVTLSIYDITGRLVETLVNETQQPGLHEVRWDRAGNPSGVYFYRLNAGSFTVTKKMVAVE